MLVMSAALAATDSLGGSDKVIFWAKSSAQEQGGGVNVRVSSLPTKSYKESPGTKCARNIHLHMPLEVCALKVCAPQCLYELWYRCGVAHAFTDK